MTYYFKGSSPSISFIKYEDPEDIYDEIKSGGATLQKKEKEKRKSKSELNEITRRDPKHKSKDHSDTIKNVQNLYDSRQKIIDLFHSDAKIRSKAIHEAKIF